LAEALGGNTDTAAAREGKEAFESGAERIRTAAAKVDDIEVLALNGDSSELYARTTALAQFGYLKELGVKFTGPGGDKGWADLSWEQVPDYP
ncbi:ABC transporter substrate-binding protein, partial [Stenotrophomonas maltophilia]